MKALGLPYKDVEPDIKQLLSQPDHVFGDSKEFLQQKTQDDVELTILSFGDPEWQDVKIKAFLELIGMETTRYAKTDKPKQHYIAEHQVLAGGCLIDDKDVHDLPERYRKISIDRRGKTNSALSELL